MGNLGHVGRGWIQSTMNYTDLDLNARINLKGTYEHFIRIAMEKFQEKQMKTIYNRVTYKIYKRRKGNDRWVNPHTKALYNSFQGVVNMKEGGDKIKISFLMYGRFVDAGVGRETGTNESLYKKRYGAARSGIKRSRKRWYSKTKAHQQRRLAEILAKYEMQGMVQLVETVLNQAYITIQ